MSNPRLEQAKQDLALAMANELAIAAEVASAQQRQRAARKEVAHCTKQLRAAEARAAYEASLVPVTNKSFF